MKTLIAILVLLSACSNDEEWQQFVQDHHCIVTEKMPGNSYVVSNGSVVFIPSKTAYKCDDGIIYWRDDQ